MASLRSSADWKLRVLAATNKSPISSDAFSAKLWEATSRTSRPMLPEEC